MQAEGQTSEKAKAGAQIDPEKDPGKGDAAEEKEPASGEASSGFEEKEDDAGDDESSKDGDAEDSDEEDSSDDEVEEKADDESDEDKDGANGADKNAELKAPEGSLLTEADVAAIQAEAKEDGLSPEQAQKRLERAHNQRQAHFDANKPGGAEWQKRVDFWKAEALKDESIAGNEKKLAETVHLAKTFADKHVPAELRQFLDESGMIHTATVIKFFAKMGKKFAPDKAVQGKGKAQAKEKSPGDLMYGEDTIEKQGVNKDDD